MGPSGFRVRISRLSYEKRFQDSFSLLEGIRVRCLPVASIRVLQKFATNPFSSRFKLYFLSDLAEHCSRHMVPNAAQ